MKKSTVVFTSAFFFLLGVVLGFVFAPIKKGLYIGNNSGNNYNTPQDEFEDEDAFLDSIPF